MTYYRDNIVKLAEAHGYKLEQEQANIGLLIFTTFSEHGAVQINVYTTTMTVGTSLKHPKQGKTQMFRRDVGMEQLSAIFGNPRVHGLGGYQVKR